LVFKSYRKGKSGIRGIWKSRDNFKIDEKDDSTKTYPKEGTNSKEERVTNRRTLRCEAGEGRT